MCFLQIFIYVGETLVSLNWALVNDILLVTVLMVDLRSHQMLL